MNTSTLNNICFGMNETEGCAVLVTDDVSNPSVRCRFVSCMERNSYICEENTAKQETNETIDRSETKTNRTKQTVRMENEKNITPTTGQEETETDESKRETTNKNTVNNEQKPINDITGRTTLLY